MMPQMGGMGMMGPGMYQSMSQRSMFTYTGIPGLSGGFSYPPGSHMTRFMDQINNTMANASMLGSMPPRQQMMGPQMGPPQQQGNNSAGMMMQMMGMMIGMMLTKAAPLIKQRMQERQGANRAETNNNNNRPSVTNEQRTGQNNVTRHRTMA